MRVLAFDPGYDRLGLAVMEKSDAKELLLYSACVVTDKKMSLAVRLAHIGREVETLIKKYTPDVIAIESLYFNKNQKTAIAVAEARGVLLYLAEIHGCVIHEYTPQEIKVAITGYGKSEKGQVERMVRKLLPSVPENALDDEYDAIAVGLTCLAILR